MAKQIYIPEPEEISKMNLDKLNAEIRRLGNIANTRMGNLARSKYEASNKALEFMMKKAGQASPEKATSFGLAGSFSTAKAKNVNAGRATLATIASALKSKKSTVKSLKETDKKRANKLSKKIFDSNANKGRKLSYDEYKEVIDLLDELRDVKGLDSNQILDTYESEATQNKFKNIDDFKKFLEERGEKGTAQMDYDSLEEGKAFEYNEETGKFMATIVAKGG